MCTGTRLLRQVDSHPSCLAYTRRTDTVENEFQGAAKFCTYSRAKYLVGILYEIGIKLFFRRVSKKAKNELKKNENQILLNRTSQVHCE